MQGLTNARIMAKLHANKKMRGKTGLLACTRSPTKPMRVSSRVSAWLVVVLVVLCVLCVWDLRVAIVAASEGCFHDRRKELEVAQISRFGSKSKA
jgi:hypothetical protein